MAQRSKLNEIFLDFEEKLANSESLDASVKLYLEYTIKLSLIDIEKSYELILKGYAYAQKFGTEEHIHKAKFMLASILFKLEKFEESLDLYKECLNYGNKVQNKEFVFKTIGNICSVYLKLELYNVVIFLNNYLLENYINPQDKISFSNVYNTLMLVYYTRLKIDKYNDELIIELISKLDKEVPFEVFFINQFKLRLGNYYFLHKKYDEALQNFEEAMSFFKEQNMSQLYSDSCMFIGAVYEETEDYNKSIFYYNESLKSMVESKCFHCREVIHQKLYDLYKKQNNIQKSFQHLEECLNFKTKNEKNQKDLRMLLSNLGFDEYIVSNTKLRDEYFKMSNHEQHRYVLAENMKSEIVKIDLDQIVMISKHMDSLKILMVENKVVYIHSNYKEFVQKIQKSTNSSRLFFETNARNQMVNLFWLAKVNFMQREIALKVLFNDYVLPVSKRQIPLLRDIICA